MDSTTEIVNQCAEYTNFIAKAFCEGGTAMYFIAAVAFLVVALILERTFTLQKLSVDKNAVSGSIFGMVLQGQIQQAVAFCDATPTPLTNTMKAGLVQVMNRRPDEEVQVAMDASVLRETPRLEGWTSFLAVFGNVSVLVGLLGTIIGLIKAFGGVAEADAATKAAHLSKGISEALNCTAFGLLVAIIAITAYGFFQIRIGRANNDMLESTMNLMNHVVSNRDKALKKS
ncbi:MAG: MotA/TolQ/ExbB proton channel family protein [Bdellovibrionales bacterium]|nr:MotA/TolQ/ExbB proton channel family protein [Bdellovibrionales bacterium]